MKRTISTIDAVAGPEDVLALRKAMGLTQPQMAALLDISMRSYQDLETGKAELRRVYALALERIALDAAVAQGDPMLAPQTVRRAALDLSRRIHG